MSIYSSWSHGEQEYSELLFARLVRPLAVHNVQVPRKFHFPTLESNLGRAACLLALAIPVLTVSLVVPDAPTRMRYTATEPSHITRTQLHRKCRIRWTSWHAGGTTLRCQTATAQIPRRWFCYYILDVRLICAVARDRKVGVPLRTLVLQEVQDNSASVRGCVVVPGESGDV